MALVTKEIYSMKLHEELKVFNTLYILRVHGGWIYTNTSDNPFAVFVPYDNKSIRRRKRSN